MPGYMDQLLEQLGWHEGARVPLASEGNKRLETTLIARQAEIQRLKEGIIAHKQKQKDLDQYKQQAYSEAHENTKLLLVQKQQVECEQSACEDKSRLQQLLDRESLATAKQSHDLRDRLDRVQNDIARLLKRADALKTEVCGERGALSEWRAALDRSSQDMSAIDMFNKQDLTKAKMMEMRRQNVKCERDRVNERLLQLCSDLAADERAAETLSRQVDEAKEERRRTMLTWACAVENLRQRDKDIRHTREDYTVLENEANSRAEECRDKTQWTQQLAADNAEGERELERLAQQLASLRALLVDRRQDNINMHVHVSTMRRELSNMHRALQELRARNKHAAEEQRRVRDACATLHHKMNELTAKKLQTADRSKSAEQRARELQAMLEEEEKYASSLTLSQQRAMHCTYSSRQKLASLRGQLNMSRVNIRGIKAAMSQLDGKQQQLEKELLSQKETLYVVCYQVETVGARVARMEGERVERESNALLAVREKRLQEVCALHAARVALLSTHADKLQEEMRRLTRDIARHTLQLECMQGEVQSRTVGADGRRAALRDAREAWRRARVEESLMKLRVAHAARAVDNLDNAAFTLQAQRLQMDAAMNERRVEVAARLDMFSVQRRALLEDCSRLRLDMREREHRIQQLQTRYDIFIASLGKDHSGQQLSVTYFKIKFASERAELRERGAQLDAEIERCEGEVAGLEATLRVLHAAHQHFVRNVQPLTDDQEEMRELHELGSEYYALHAALERMRPRVARQHHAVEQLRAQITLLTDKQGQLRARQAEAESEWESGRERLARHEIRLDNAREVVRAHTRRARKLLSDTDLWRFFHMQVWCRDYAEAAYSALRLLVEAAAGGAPDVAARIAELAAGADLQDKLPRQHRRCHALLQRLLMGARSAAGLLTDATGSTPTIMSGGGDSSSSQLSSKMDAYTRRLSGFRQRVSAKLQRSTLLEEEQPVKSSRSSVALSVVTLGLDREPVRESAARNKT